MSERRSSVRRMLRPAGAGREEDRRSAFGGGTFDDVEESIGGSSEANAAADAPAPAGPAELSHEPDPDPVADPTTPGPREQTAAERARAEASTKSRVHRETSGNGAATVGSPRQERGAPPEAAAEDALEALAAVVAAGDVATARKGYHLPEGVVWALEDLRTHFQRHHRFTAREASHSNIVAAALARYYEDTFGGKVEL